MRDIRTDLKERIASVDGRYADEMIEYQKKREALDGAHNQAVADLDRERAALKQLLAIEDARTGTPADVAEARKTAQLLPLAEFLITKAYAQGPLERDQLRAEANLAGYFEDATGRTFHTTLMNITKVGKLIQLPDGRYDHPNRNRTSLFSEALEQSGEVKMQTLM